MRVNLQRMPRRVAVLALLAMLGWAAGCATTDPPDSDIPWNSPQPWEGSPLIPGLENR